jgi:hypothetical protein
VSSIVPQLNRLAYHALLAGLLLVVASAQAGIKSERLLAQIVQHSPEPKLVAAGDELKQAELAAAKIQGASAFWGVGRSMEPLYASSTAIVVAPIRYKELKKGMTVLYINSRGLMVAHALTGDLPKGWIAQGVGNDDEDDDLVTPHNLVGVIVEAYARIQSDYRTALVKQLISKGRIPASQS